MGQAASITAELKGITTEIGSQSTAIVATQIGSMHMIELPHTLATLRMFGSSILASSSFVKHLYIFICRVGLASLATENTADLSVAMALQATPCWKLSATHRQQLLAHHSSTISAGLL